MTFRLFARPLPVGELRLLAPYDAPALLECIAADREHFGQWLGWARDMRTPEDASGFVARGMKRLAEDAAPWVGIWLDGVLVGGVLVWPVDHAGGSAELGYWLARSAGGRGVVTEAVRAMTTFCFEELDLRKVVIRCAEKNTPSRRVPERLGFVVEGVLREQIWWNDEPHDLMVYGMLRRDWPQR
ncbi:GNAT family protein [Longispora sp. K20-0274]|uniref:GNAT family N-acetyltransferase n=1 Tax=Longispora sp. K20-0274 TaxID=3088255 RepID=UPI00399B583A